MQEPSFSFCAQAKHTLRSPGQEGTGKPLDTADCHDSVTTMARSGRNHCLCHDRILVSTDLTAEGLRLPRPAASTTRNHQRRSIVHRKNDSISRLMIETKSEIIPTVASCTLHKNSVQSANMWSRIGKQECHRLQATAQGILGRKARLLHRCTLDKHSVQFSFS